MEKSRYYLSKHAFFCLADNHFVFLDLRSDAYLCLKRTHTDAIKGLLNGKQVVDESSSVISLRGTDDSDSRTAIQTLLQKELLVRDATLGKRPLPECVNAPSASTMERTDNSRPGIRTAHVWNFFAAAATASMNLRRQSIERTVRTVEDRKSAHISTSNAADNGIIAGLFDIFQTLRPYYPRSYLCLFDSLALVHFLARYDVFPQWVYGVRLEPFAAHCWVQAGDFVVNDIMDNVREYTPIMSV